ncbi:hypothetical protein ANN_17338 [Periplaneta americana]|uniref:Reverse transcriptase domain-containing protein n=1 Tax=Periplaneta americana TaxID=6978 RepID=A0ABQ8SSN2_PERAM|nr:hypothetical protein ANN_17338 [Periplaneta americana]
MNCIFCLYIDILTLRFQRRTIERLLEHVESFTWEDMPLRDVETGEVTMAGYVPKIKTIAKGLVPFLYGVHITQSCVRVILYRELMYDTLYPFDTSIQFRINAVDAGYLRACPTSQRKMGEIKRNKTIDAVQSASPFLACEISNANVKYKCFTFATVIAMLRISLFFIGAPYFYAAFICIGCTQLEKVKYLLLQMKQNTSGPEKEEFEDCNKRNEDFTLQKKLNDVYESVGNAVFASDWVGTPVRYQTCISFMIAMSNQGFSLTAAKFAPVSNATLMNMEEQLEEEQFDFTKGKGTKDAIGLLRRIGERNLKKNKEVYVLLVDQEKAYGRVDLNKLIGILTK